MDKKTLSYGIGRRLKNLREDKGLSYKALKDAISDKYGLEISVDSLRDYEIESDFRSKAAKLPNMGMRLEYLYVFSDFYGVSTDYLLGLDPNRAINPDIKSACKCTGLSETSVNLLQLIHKGAGGASKEIDVVNTLLSDISIRGLLLDISNIEKSKSNSHDILSSSAEIIDEVKKAIECKNLDARLIDILLSRIATPMYRLEEIKPHEQLARFVAIDSFIKLIDSVYPLTNFNNVQAMICESNDLREKLVEMLHEQRI